MQFDTSCLLSHTGSCHQEFPHRELVVVSSSGPLGRLYVIKTVVGSDDLVFGSLPQVIRHEILRENY